MFAALNKPDIFLQRYNAVFESCVSRRGICLRPRRHPGHPPTATMAPPNQLFARIFQWLANEVIVKGLSNNRAFQQFAVRSSQQAAEASKAASEAAKALSESQNVAQLKNETAAMRERAVGLAAALREEIGRSAAEAAEQINTATGVKKPPSPPAAR